MRLAAWPLSGGLCPLPATAVAEDFQRDPVRKVLESVVD
jgi:hypothetical protein